MLAQLDPVPLRKGESWTYTKINGTYESAQPFFPILEKNTVKVPSRDAQNKIVKDDNGKVVMRDSIFYKEVTKYAAVQKGEKWGFIDALGKPITEFKYDFVYDFCPEGFAAVGVQSADSPFPQMTFIDRTGKEITPPKFIGVSNFSDGLAAVSIFDEVNGTAPFGFIDKTGQIVVPLKYDQVHDFHEGRAAVNVNGKWGFIDAKGNLVIAPQFNTVYDFSEGLSRASNSIKWGFIDNQGREIIKFNYDGLPSDNDQNPGLNYGLFVNGLARVRQGSQEGFIDGRGVLKIPLENISARDFSEELAAVKNRRTGNHWAYIDRRNMIRIAPEQIKKDQTVYNPIDVGDFSDGMAPILVGMKWGFIDTSGKVVIDVKYDRIKKPFTRGIALVALGDSYFYIDKTGKEYK
ncbi:MAG: hypothetical protein OHK0053_08090 [Microscillaceae bacterium]